MIYKIYFFDQDEKEPILSYDTQKNNFYRGKTRIKIIDDVTRKFTREYSNIRVVLGRDCNLCCAYCQQNNSRENVKEKMNVDEFYRHLKHFLNGTVPDRFGFWGGEPLLYFNEMKAIHQKVQTDMAVANFYTITNGLLLNEEITDWLIENKITIVVSYDGPGQHLRGYDLANDPKTVSNLKRLNQAGILFFNFVITQASKDIVLYKESVKSMMGTEDFKLAGFSALNINDEEGYKTRVEEDCLPLMRDNIYFQYMEGKLKNVFNINNIIQDFFRNLNNKNTLRRCLALSEEFFPIDMEGNILACHNFNKDYKLDDNNFCFGNIKNSKINMNSKLKPKKIREWSYKRKDACDNCLVKHFCNRGCIYQNADYEEYACKFRRFYYTAFFEMAASILGNGRIIQEIVPER